MLAYFIRRVGYSLVLVLLVSFVGFLIIELPPGDYLTQKLAELQARGDKSAEYQIEVYRQRYGLDKPLLTRYWIWASNFLKGDFGESFQFERPVRELLGERVTMTIVLTLATLAVTWLIALPIGIYSAVKQYTVGDQVITTLSFIGLGMPGFLLGLILLFFAVVVLEVDVGGLFSREFRDASWSMARVLDLLKHLWIPAIIGSVTGAAGLVRIMRGNLLDVMGQPFVEAARARGLKNRTVVLKHAVRIAILPLIVILGSESFPSIIGGNALVAIVLNLPTVGPLYINALRKQDMYMGGTCLVFFTLFLLVGNLLADFGLAWADPRIRLE